MITGFLASFGRYREVSLLFNLICRRFLHVIYNQHLCQRLDQFQFQADLLLYRRK